jgi:hypothetical protein
MFPMPYLPLNIYVGKQATILLAETKTNDQCVPIVGTSSYMGYYMTDIEMLKLIADYIGLHVKAHRVTEDDRFLGLIVGKKYTKEKINWNPLENGEDTLRLAADLKIQYVFKHFPHGIVVQAYDGNSPAVYIALGNDPVKAIKRAIVKCAFGQLMKDTRRVYDT